MKIHNEIFILLLKEYTLGNVIKIRDLTDFCRQTQPCQFFIQSSPNNVIVISDLFLSNVINELYKFDI